MVVYLTWNSNTYSLIIILGESEISIIIATMEKMQELIAVNNVTCIQFRPRIPSDQYFITIRNSDGYSSYVILIFMTILFK